MRLKLQTSKGNDIPNEQGAGIATYERNWFEDLGKAFPAVIVKGEMSSVYNCHGYTFASRRTFITERSDIDLIINDDGYNEIDCKDAMPGDVVIYFHVDGEATHSGIVVENLEPLFNPLIVSKWGKGPEVIHYLAQVHRQYGNVHKFYRCLL